MKFLADEGCDFVVVRALRKQGYDVLAVCEMASSMEDLDIMHLAGKEKRFLITEDKDFGQIFYAFMDKKYTVILIRYPNAVRKQLALDIVALIKSHGSKITGSFVVIQPGRVRFSKS
jgi:predicted nuclease of predicted toxin-antitoxin system